VRAGDLLHILLRLLKKSFGERSVLDIDSGEIKHGSRTAVIGPNGAGKSTLLNIMAGILKPTCGNIYYDGSKEFPGTNISLVFQEPYLISSTVEKNIAYPLKIRGFSKEDILTRTNLLMEELNLHKIKKQRPWNLSGGEKQKVALARALSFKPGLLLLDEPTANIDPHTTAEIEKMLIEIGEKEDITVVTVTHNLAQARRMCDQVIMMHAGKIIETGDCENILKKPCNEITRKFIEGELLI
jgi:tungstate transport system ATP-binding protein